MPTIPPEQARPFETHRQRQVAESFGSDAGRYDRARPSYPGALVDRIVAVSPGRDVLDIGCGTGIAAGADIGTLALTLIGTAHLLAADRQSAQPDTEAVAAMVAAVLAGVLKDRDTAV